MSDSYLERRGEIETYFDRTAAHTWQRLTSDAPVSGIRATVRAGRDRMRSTLLSFLPDDLRGCRVLDAGCGLGHGLQALRHAYPKAQFYGIEWSATLRWLCALRLPWARISRGDIWLADWSGYQMVYLFQRPESMARALAMR